MPVGHTGLCSCTLYNVCKYTFFIIWAVQLSRGQPRSRCRIDFVEVIKTLSVVVYTFSFSTSLYLSLLALLPL